MKIKVLKPFGKLKAGDYHKTETDTQGEHLIEKKLAEKAKDDEFPKEKDVDSKPKAGVNTSAGVIKDKK